MPKTYVHLQAKAKCEKQTTLQPAETLQYMQHTPLRLLVHIMSFQSCICNDNRLMATAVRR